MRAQHQHLDPDQRPEKGELRREPGGWVKELHVPDYNSGHGGVGWNSFRGNDGGRIGGVMRAGDNCHRTKSDYAMIWPDYNGSFRTR